MTLDYYNALWRPSDIAKLVDVPTDQVRKWVDEQRIPYIQEPEGIFIPIQSFITCMPDLFSLEEDLARVDELTKDVEPQDEICGECGLPIHPLRPGLCLNCRGYGR